MKSSMCILNTKEVVILLEIYTPKREQTTHKKPRVADYRKVQKEPDHSIMIHSKYVLFIKDRRLYADANSLGIMDPKLSKEALDKLVEETKITEALREAKGRKKLGDDDSDISIGGTEYSTTN